MDERVTVVPGWKLPAVDADLRAVAVLTIAGIASMYLPFVDETPLRALFGLLMAVYVPGYALLAAVFPGKKPIGTTERTGMAIGFSIAMTSMIGIGLNFTEFGIRQGPILACLALVIAICAIAAHFRRRRLSPEDRYSPAPGNVWADVKNVLFPAGERRLDRVLTVVLLMLVASSIGLVAYMILAPHSGEHYTEFYLLGPDGKAEGYPALFSLGDTSQITVGISNHEQRAVDYDLVVELNDSSQIQRLYSEHFSLEDNQTVEKSVKLSPDHAGTDMKLEFLLYKDGDESTEYRETHLWVNVT